MLVSQRSKIIILFLKSRINYFLKSINCFVHVEIEPRLQYKWPFFTPPIMLFEPHLFTSLAIRVSIKINPERVKAICPIKNENDKMRCT